MGQIIGELLSWGIFDVDIVGFNVFNIDMKYVEVFIDVKIMNFNFIFIFLIDIIYEILSEGRKFCFGIIFDVGMIYVYSFEIVKILFIKIYKDIVDILIDI